MHSVNGRRYVTAISSLNTAVVIRGDNMHCIHRGHSHTHASTPQKKKKKEPTTRGRYVRVTVRRTDRSWERGTPGKRSSSGGRIVCSASRWCGEPVAELMVSGDGLSYSQHPPGCEEGWTAERVYNQHVIVTPHPPFMSLPHSYPQLPVHRLGSHGGLMNDTWLNPKKNSVLKTPVPFAV